MIGRVPHRRASARSGGLRSVSVRGSVIPGDPVNRYLVVVLPATNGGGEEGGLADGLWATALRSE